MSKAKLRGISPVVATALLILIAIAASVILYVWITGTVTTATSGTEALAERFKIDTAYKNSSDYLTIVVRNIGDVPVDITAVYVYSLDGKLLANDTSISNGYLDVGETKPITTSINATGLANKRIVVKAVSAYGTEAMWTGRIRG